MNCENHPDQRAEFVASMKSPTAPYERSVHLCAECGPRIETIGFPVVPIAPEIAPDHSGQNGSREDEA